MCVCVIHLGSRGLAKSSFARMISDFRQRKNQPKILEMFLSWHLNIKSAPVRQYISGRLSSPLLYVSCSMGLVTGHPSVKQAALYWEYQLLMKVIMRFYRKHNYNFRRNWVLIGRRNKWTWQLMARMLTCIVWRALNLNKTEATPLLRWRTKEVVQPQIVDVSPSSARWWLSDH